MEPSRFWLRRDDDDRARQVVYDQVQLNRYSDRQKRAILKLMARGKPASYREIREAARRARVRSRGEILVTTALALAMLALLVIALAGPRRSASQRIAIDAAINSRTTAGARTARPEDLTTVMEKADRAWLTDVGAGKVVAAKDGSDALSLPQSAPPDAAPEQSATGHRRARQKAQQQPR